MGIKVDRYLDHPLNSEMEPSRIRATSPFVYGSNLVQSPICCFPDFQISIAYFQLRLKGEVERRALFINEAERCHERITHPSADQINALTLRNTEREAE